MMVITWRQHVDSVVEIFKNMISLSLISQRSIVEKYIRRVFFDFLIKSSYSWRDESNRCESRQSWLIFSRREISRILMNDEILVSWHDYSFNWLKDTNLQVIWLTPVSYDNHHFDRLFFYRLITTRNRRGSLNSQHQVTDFISCNLSIVVRCQSSWEVSIHVWEDIISSNFFCKM